MLKPYLVDGGAVQFGPGTLIGLSREQFEPRRHRLRHSDGTVIDRKKLPPVERVQKHGEVHLCRANELIEFKVGELIFLTSAPERSQAANLIPQGHDDEIKRAPQDAGDGDKRKAAAAAKAKKKAAAKAAAAAAAEQKRAAAEKANADEAKAKAEAEAAAEAEANAEADRQIAAEQAEADLRPLRAPSPKSHAS